MKRFEQIDHPSDIGLIAYGKSPEETLANAAYGMFSLMTDLNRVKSKVSFEINIKADDLESLLVQWLSELLYLYETKLILFNEFKINSLTKNKISATVLGESIEAGRHQIARHIKAVTYHQLTLKNMEGQWIVSVIFDV